MARAFNSHYGWTTRRVFSLEITLTDAQPVLELCDSRSTDVECSAVVAAKYNVVLQKTLMSYYTGDLTPESTAL